MGVSSPHSKATLHMALCFTADSSPLVIQSSYPRFGVAASLATRQWDALPWRKALPMLKHTAATNGDDTASGYEDLNILKVGITQNLQLSGSSRKFTYTRPFDRHVYFTAYQEGRETLIWEQLESIPPEELIGKVVLVRCHLAMYLNEGKMAVEEAVVAAIPTILYLQNAGARILLASSWHPSISPLQNTDTQLIAGCLSKHINQEVLVAGGIAEDATRIQIEMLGNGRILLLGNLQLYKEEAENSKKFARKLAENVDIFVNDAFPIAHRVLASTVAIGRYTDARVAGLQLTKELYFLKMAMEIPRHPFIAIIGGAKISKIVGVFSSLINKCDTIFLTGCMVHTFLFALGCQQSSECIEKEMMPQVVELLRMAQEKDVKIVVPRDFMCARGQNIQVVKAGSLQDGWRPIFPGPQSLEDINMALQAAKMAIWIGPISMSCHVVVPELCGLFAECFARTPQSSCITIAGGKEARTAIMKAGVNGMLTHLSTGGCALLNILKGITLPGVAALDIAYSTPPDWQTVYKNPYLPLCIDVGSGNGLFCLEMSKRHTDSNNFLGLEINKKLVDRCIACAGKLQLSNMHFIAADATSILRRSLSNYPGQVSLVAIQCPDPNFVDLDSRWRMVQRPLIKAVVNMLCKGGKVFLQTDIEAVAVQLKSDFLEYGKECLGISIEHQDPRNCDAEGWLKENPFGILTDWEAHVLERGDRMYRLMISKHTV